MDISKREKWSPSSNVYDDLRAVDSLSGPKIPRRSTSTISHISPRDPQQVKRSTVSLILPVPITSSEQNTTLDTILSMNDTERSSSAELERKDSIKTKDYNSVFEEDVQSCICQAVRLLIQLICIALLACFIGVFVFTLISYAFDNYWLEQPFTNHSFWWFNFTEFDYDLITQTIDYDDQY